MSQTPRMCKTRSRDKKQLTAAMNKILKAATGKDCIRAESDMPRKYTCKYIETGILKELRENK